MSIKITVPDIGVDEVEITEILVHIGDKVKTEQSLIVVEGDKASIEIPAPQEGIVKSIQVTVGEKVKTGTVIMIFEGKDSVQIEDKKQSQNKTNLFSSDSKENSIISNRSLIIDKNNKPSINYSENHFKFSNIVSKKMVNPLLAPNYLNDQENFLKNGAYAHASPLIRRLAREFSINLEKIKGSGHKNRILREDIQIYIKNAIKHFDTTFISNKQDKKLSLKCNFKKFGDIEEINIGRIQKISGDNLTYNWKTIPHVTHFDKLDFTDLNVFMKKQNQYFSKCKVDIKLTPIMFIIKVVAIALKKFPRFNSSLNEDGQKIVLKKYINIGVAVDTLDGLVVPVLKNVDKKNITQISQELKIILEKSRNGKLTMIDMQGGCFTISSLGSIGTTYFTPIINAPEVAILGVSKIVTEPVWNDKEFIPRLMLPISLSFDHRVIDGATGAKFITIINQMLSDIRSLIML